MTEVLLALVSLATGALEPKLEVEVAPNELTVGDRAEVVIALTLPEGVAREGVAWPEWPEALGDAEVLEVGPVEPVAGPGSAHRLTQRLQVAFFRVGELSMPSLALELDGPEGAQVLRSQPASVTVHSVLPEGDTPPEPKPPAPPRSLAFGKDFWWMAGAMALTCLVAMALLVQRSSGLESESAARPWISPRDELEQALQDLNAETNVVRLHAGASLATRRYLGRSLLFPAAESTTTEVQRELRQKDLPNEVVRSTGDLLRSCDMVKFARQPVDLETAQERVASARGIAEEVEAILTRRQDDETDHDVDLDDAGDVIDTLEDLDE